VNQKALKAAHERAQAAARRADLKAHRYLMRGEVAQLARERTEEQLRAAIPDPTKRAHAALAMLEAKHGLTAPDAALATVLDASAPAGAPARHSRALELLAELEERHGLAPKTGPLRTMLTEAVDSGEVDPELAVWLEGELVDGVKGELAALEAEADEDEDAEA
jgi:hypothetical protein